MSNVPNVADIPDPAAATEPPNARMPYLPALDGIRALAVLAVVVFHANESWLSGGFLGVDVFFVVSGFLITALLVGERERSGGVDLRAFWARRARRLLPALALVLAVTTLYAVVVLGDQLLTHLREVLAAVAYVTNWDLIIRDISYFESFDRPSQLRHLWSLAVEEQFYLLWPLLFAALSRFVSRRALLAIVLALATASLLWMTWLYQPGEDPSRVYFGSDPRAFTILLGVALGLVWHPWRWQWPDARPGLGRLLDALGLLGLVAVILIMQQGHWREAWLYPWGLLAASAASAALIAAVARRRSDAARALSLPPLRWLGTRSYGVYLWHWPVLLALSYEYSLSGWQLFAAGAALSAALAELSYRLVETPIRRREFWQTLRREPPRIPRRAWYAAALSVFAAAALGLLLINAEDSAAFPEAEQQATTSFVAAAAPQEDDADISAPTQSSAAPTPDPDAAPDATQSPLIVSDASAAAAEQERPTELIVSRPRAAAPADAADALDDLPSRLPAVPEPILNPPPPHRPAAFAYIIQIGDSPGTLARTFGVELDELVELNGEQILEVVHVDDVLYVPCPGGAPCAVVEIALRGAGCVRWSSALGEERACRGVRALVGLPAAFAAESGPLASDTVWEWGGARIDSETFAVTETNLDAGGGPASARLIARLGVAPLAIGDSVMKHAVRMLSERGLDVDAVGGRTAYQSMKALEKHLAAGPREVVVFHGVGYEFVDTDDFDRLMRIVEDVDHLIVLTRQFPPRDPWIRLERDGNELIRRESAKYDKVTMIDWNQVTNGREDELTTDGTHLRPDGLALYVQMIVDAIAAGPSGVAE